ncbi:hypothetical protein HHI36_006946, partial [Cryptolaemus montrouzieri]
YYGIAALYLTKPTNSNSIETKSHHPNHGVETQRTISVRRLFQKIIGEHDKRSVLSKNRRIPKKKDSSSCNELWNNFKSNHAEIKGKLDPTHNYLAKDFHGQVEKAYDETAEYIQKCQVKAAGPNGSTNVEDEADLIPDIIKQQYVKINLFNKAINNINLQLT